MIRSAARIRLEREIRFEPAIEIDIELFPDEGPFAGAVVHFTLSVSEMYPHRPPKARIHEKLFHPNFDLEGHVCLNILRLDWNPVLGITAVFFGLMSILLAPEGEEPLNQEAGEMIQTDPDLYYKVARECAFGGTFKDILYDKIIRN